MDMDTIAVAVAALMLIIFVIVRRSFRLKNVSCIESMKRKEAILKESLILKDDAIFRKIKAKKKKPCYIGGVDVSYPKTHNRKACVALAVVSFPELELVYTKEKIFDQLPEYIPSFLAFREGPCIKNLLDEMKREKNLYIPHVLMFDGNGILHPRDFGCACHIGIDSDIPCIGVAKSLYTCHGIKKDADYYKKVEQLEDKGASFPLVRSSDKKTIAKADQCSRKVVREWDSS